MIFSYYKGNSLLHRLNPLAKFAAVFASCTLSFLSSSVLLTMVYLAVVVAIAFLTGTEQILQVMRTKFATFLGLWLILANAIFTPAGRVLISIPLYFFSIKITEIGLLMGIVMAVRFLTVFLMSALFVCTTEPSALVYSLMRRGLPYRYGFMLIIMLRFIPVFEKEMKIVSDAQKMRGLEIDTFGLKKLYRSLRFTLIPLIVSALSKTDCLVMSMEGRAFGYQPTRTFTMEDRYEPRDKALLCASGMIVFLVLAVKFTGGRLFQGMMF
jgi:energy-coupling factor transport system permease protein